MLTGLNHITLTVKDLEQSLDFYTSVLGMKPIVKWKRGAYLTLNELWFCLSCGKPIPSNDYSHISLNVEEDNFSQIAENLLNSSVQIWKENVSEGSSIYFLDPNGHKLEVHAGSLDSRLAKLKDNPYEGLQWF